MLIVYSQEVGMIRMAGFTVISLAGLQNGNLKGSEALRLKETM